MKRHHSLWCNCAECVRWRGCRVPEARVEALDARLAFLNTRSMMPFLIGVDFASGPDRVVIASDAQLRADIEASAKFVPWWETLLTTRDVAFLKELRIDPWK